LIVPNAFLPRHKRSWSARATCNIRHRLSSPHQEKVKAILSGIQSGLATFFVNGARQAAMGFMMMPQTRWTGISGCVVIVRSVDRAIGGVIPARQL
ncbi:MAG TPA: hypothetical protein VMM76_17110, partial [Pirellulaceae bacterium]|nr:hypothetical protein [Pirellulaceae bacterium]